jgi:hypothetical protein
MPVAVGTIAASKSAISAKRMVMRGMLLANSLQRQPNPAG